jgi:hypothetical protein
VIKGCREMHNEELHNLYSLSNIVRVFKSWRTRWVRHAARKEQIKMIREFCLEILKGKT